MSLEIVLLFQNIVLYKQRTICLIFDNLVPKYAFTQYFTQISQNVTSGFHIFCKIVQSNSHVTEKFMKAQKSLILWILWKGSTMTDRLFKMRHSDPQHISLTHLVIQQIKPELYLICLLI